MFPKMNHYKPCLQVICGPWSISQFALDADGHTPLRSCQAQLLLLCCLESSLPFLSPYGFPTELSQSFLLPLNQISSLFLLSPDKQLPLQSPQFQNTVSVNAFSSPLF